MTANQLTTKERIFAVVYEQPDDSSYDEILHELVFIRMIERGLADADAGRVVSHDDMKRRIDAWSEIVWFAHCERVRSMFSPPSKRD